MGSRNFSNNTVLHEQLELLPSDMEAGYTPADINMADMTADAKQMAFEWETYVDEEEIARQLKHGDVTDDFHLWDSSHGIGYIITHVIELREVPIQVLRPLGRQLKPVYVPRETQTNDLVNAHYFK